jgi:hypothetical protein
LRRREARAADIGEAEQLEELIPDALEFALTPYLGTAAARRIISAA